MAGLSATGFVPKRYAEILSELNTSLSTNLGVNLDTSANSVVGIQHGILASQLASLWELAENVYDGFDLLKAEGEQIDNLALLQGIVRLAAQSTRGIAWFTGNDGVEITKTAIVTSLAGDKFLPEEDFTIGASNCIGTLATVELLIPDAVYQISIDGVAVTHISTGSDTLETIRDSLYDKLALIAGTFTVQKIGTNQLRLDSSDGSIAMQVTSTSYLTFSEVTTPAIVVSQQLGYISGDAFSIINIETPVNGWENVLNPTDLNLGRNEETDEELRARILNTYTTIGSGTPDTIVQRVLDVANVQSANIYENDKWMIDTTLTPNLPPKSYTVTVYDGDTNDIAQVIWDTKPAGIQTVGNTDVTITDSFGQQHEVHFSRPEIMYVWVKVDYSLYDEELFPADGEDRMKTAMLVYGDQLTINEDVIPKRFYGQLYSNVNGLDDVVITMAITNDPSITDPNDGRLTYTADRIGINAAQVSTFGTARMNLTQV